LKDSTKRNSTRTKFSKLQVLNLSRTKITDVTIQIISKATISDNLQQFSIEQTKISKDIYDYIRDFPLLTILKFRGCDVPQLSQDKIDVMFNNLDATLSIKQVHPFEFHFIKLFKVELITIPTISNIWWNQNSIDQYLKRINFNSKKRILDLQLH